MFVHGQGPACCIWASWSWWGWGDNPAPGEGCRPRNLLLLAPVARSGGLLSRCRSRAGTAATGRTSTRGAACGAALYSLWW